MNEHILYTWVFHYNTHTKLWYAFHREDYRAYWNGEQTKFPVIKSKAHSVLVQILEHTKGDPIMIEKL